MSWVHTWEFTATQGEVEDAIQRVLAEYPGMKLDDEDDWIEDDASEDVDDGSPGLDVGFVVPAAVAAEMLQRASLRFGDPEPFYIELQFVFEDDGTGYFTATQLDEVDQEIAEAIAQKLGAVYSDLG